MKLGVCTFVVVACKNKRAPTPQPCFEDAPGLEKKNVSESRFSLKNGDGNGPVNK